MLACQVAGPMRVGNRLGARRDRYFVGRAAELDLFQGALDVRKVALLFVHGPRGVGKSVLLREVGRHKRDPHPRRSPGTPPAAHASTMPPNPHKPEDPEPDPTDVGYGTGPDDLRAGTRNLNNPTETPTTNPLPIHDSRATPDPEPD